MYPIRSFIIKLKLNKRSRIHQCIGLAEASGSRNRGDQSCDLFHCSIRRLPMISQPCRLRIGFIKSALRAIFVIIEQTRVPLGRYPLDGANPSTRRLERIGAFLFFPCFFSSSTRSVACRTFLREI